MKQNTKDWIQYSSAIALIVSAIVLVFTSFVVINDVTAGVNAYIGIAISGALAIFGVSAYMVSQVASFKTEIRKELRNIQEEESRHPSPPPMGEGHRPHTPREWEPEQPDKPEQP